MTWLPKSSIKSGGAKKDKEKLTLEKVRNGKAGKRLIGKTLGVANEKQMIISTDESDRKQRKV
jgi:hypothetical protein